MSLNFLPLYWIYHDGWKYKESKSYTVPKPNGGTITIDKSKTFNHPGHIHFFMPDFPVDSKETLAYSGEQTYTFRITDTWGPNSTDPNQSKNIKLVGKPIWYFWIEEYWRRIYIQPWENTKKNYILLESINYSKEDNDRFSYTDENGNKKYFTKNDIRTIDNKEYIDISTSDIGKEGIKYDASKPEHSFGPFREGGQFYFFNTILNRSMPIEYWKEKSKHTRDYFIKNGEEDTTGGQTWTFPSKDQIFNYIYETHYIVDSWSSDNWSYSIGRFRDIFAPTRNRHTRIFYGTNAKRLKQDLDNSSINPIKNEEEDYWKGWESRGWSGWFEYSGKSITANSLNPRENIMYCDPEASYSKGSYGRYYSEKDASKKKPHQANYYKRIYKPIGYNISDTSQWTKKIRQHFPSPPPYLNPEDREDLVQLYWEYLIYYDKVCYYVRSGNKTILNYEKGRWETYLRDYAIEHNKMEDIQDESSTPEFSKYLSFNDYQICFQNFLNEHSDYFFQFEITATQGTSQYNTQLRRKNNGTNPQGHPNNENRDVSIIQDTFENGIWKLDYNKGSVVSDACEMYLSFDEFCNDIWKPLNADEIKLLKLNGDYPTLIRELPKYPSFQEEDSSSSSDNSYSAFNELSSSNSLDFTRNGKITPDEVWKSYFDKKEIYTIPENTMAKGDYSYGADESNYQYVHPREASFSIEDGARWNYPDTKFIHPVIEYQKIIHCGNEENEKPQRLPNKRNESDIYGFNGENPTQLWRNDKTGDWGDGFEITITIPFKKNEEIQSPFSGKDRITMPPGNYFHDVVKEENKMRYHVEWFDSLLQIRKYDFPTYVSLIKEFQAKYHDYNEDFAQDNNEVQNYYNAEYTYKDESGNYITTTWSDLLNKFFEEINQIHNFSNTPITKRDDEGKFDETTGVYRDKVTQNLVTMDQVSTVTNPDGTITYGYINSKGNIVKGGNVVQFNNPYPDHTDGKWVEQCLGAIVKPTVLLVLEDSMGYRWIETVTATALTSDTPLQGNGL